MGNTEILKIEQDYFQLNNPIKKFDFLINLFEEYRGQSLMLLDPCVAMDEVEERAFENLGEFIFQKMDSLKALLFV